MSTAGLVLAAGAGTRYGQPKAPVVVDGSRLVDRAVSCLREAGCDPVLVVLGAWVGDVPDAEVVVNDEWDEGMGSSLRCGLSELLNRHDVESTVITLVDLPGLTPEAVRRIARTPGDVAIATYDGQRGHPVRIARQHWPAVIAVARGDEGARRFLSSREDLVLVEVGDVADGQDLDEADDA